MFSIRRSPKLPPAAAPPIQLTLRAQIRDIAPPIWRTLVVPSTLTLDDLHRTFQVAFGWQNYHLYEFAQGESTLYCPDDPDGDFFFMRPKPKSTALPLADLKLSDGANFGYLYDMGDSWVTDVTVTASRPLEPAELLDIPVVTGGERSGPPEDSGGPWGYEDKLTVLKRGRGRAYEELREWIGNDFDPERFDLAAVNKRLHAVFRPVQRKVKPPKGRVSKSVKPPKSPLR
jgi:hypothetical protein